MHLNLHSRIVVRKLEERTRRRHEFDFALFAVDGPGKCRVAGKGWAIAEEEGECCVWDGLGRGCESGVEGEEVRHVGGNVMCYIFRFCVGNAEGWALYLGFGMDACGGEGTEG